MRSETSQAVGLLRHAAAPDRHHLMAGFIWLMAAAGLEVIGPLLGKSLIDNYLLPRRTDTLQMISLLGGMLCTGWAASVIRYLQLVRLSGLAMRSMQRLRERVYNHVLRLPIAFFDQAMIGQLIGRVTNDTEAVKSLYIQVLFVILDSSIVLIGALVAMAWLDWRLMLIVLMLFPAVLLIVWLYQRWSAPAVALARELRSEINAQIAESIGGMTVLQASNATQRFRLRMLTTSRAHYQARLSELRANAWLLRPALDLLNVLLLAGVIYGYGQRTLSGLEIGVLYAFVSYIARVVEPLIQITLQFGQLQQSVVAAARVNALLQQEVGDQQGGSVGIGDGAVSIRHLNFAYHPEQIVLNDFSLTIPAGSFYGIVGPTGSGKSTLLNLLLRFYVPQSGAIDIGGCALSSVSDAVFRAEVGFVPQEALLISASARENIDMGRGYPQSVIEAAARAAKAHTFITALEMGYDTPLSEGGARLSTGQKQLISIARALAGQPRVLLLDEATSHIDSETEQLVQAALHELRGNMTIIAIAHRLSTIREADQIVVMNHGRLAEAGTHDALMAIEGGIYQKLYLLQQQPV